MKRLALTLAGIVLAVSLASCKCSAERDAVGNVSKTHTLISVRFLKYVDADATLSDADRKDWHALVESDARNIEALRKSLGD